MSIAATIGGALLPIFGAEFMEDVGMTDPIGAAGDGDVRGLRSTYLKMQLIGRT